MTTGLGASSFLVLGAAMAMLTIVLAWRAHRFLARAVQTSGRIAYFSEEKWQRQRFEGGSITETAYHPHVEFSLADGSRIVFRSRMQKANQVLQGTSVSVVYDPKAPATTAEIAGPTAWLAAWMPVVLSGAITAGVFIFYYAEARSWK